MPCQPLCHRSKHRPVPRQRMMCVKDDRVVTPPDDARSENRRELMKGTHDLLPWRHMGLNIPAVWRDGDIPELPERREEIHIGKHRCGILRAEADEVNYARVNAIARHLMYIVGITDTDLARTQPIHQPRRIERRNIRALPCVEYHRAPPPLFHRITRIGKKEKWGCCTPSTAYAVPLPRYNGEGFRGATTAPL